MPQRSYGRELRKNLQYQMWAAPQLYQAEAALRPYYQGLELEGLNSLLNGTPAQDLTYYDWFYDPTARGPGGGGANVFGDVAGRGGGGMPAGSGWMNPVVTGGGGRGELSTPSGGGVGAGFGSAGFRFPTGGGGVADTFTSTAGATGGPNWPTATMTRGPQRGILSLYEQDINPALARMDSYRRGADIADVSRLGPEAREAIRRSDPESASILDMLNEQAQSELAMGTDIDPALSRIVSQTIRGRQAGTMLSNGNAGAYDEALGMSMFGNDLRNQRRAFASGVTGMNRAFYGDPYDRVLRPGSAVGEVAGVTGQAGGIGQTMGARMFNPESGYAGSLRSGNQAVRAAESMASADARRQLTGDLVGGGIGILGAVAGV